MDLTDTFEINDLKQNISPETEVILTAIKDVDGQIDHLNDFLSECEDPLFKVLDCTDFEAGIQSYLKDLALSGDIDRWNDAAVLLDALHVEVGDEHYLSFCDHAKHMNGGEDFISLTIDPIVGQYRTEDEPINTADDYEPIGSDDWAVVGENDWDDGPG